MWVLPGAWRSHTGRGLAVPEQVAWLGVGGRDPPGSSPPGPLGATQTTVASQRPIQLEWRLGQSHAMRWFIIVIEYLHLYYSLSRAEKRGPINS